MHKTLDQLLKPHELTWTELLEKEYRDLFTLVETQIGLIPDCDLSLAIWPSAFHSYSLLFPAFLNLPKLMLNKQSDITAVGLVMYATSYTIGCPYSTCHACGFALRRGLKPKIITDVTTRSAGQKAAIAFAENLSSSPSQLTENHLLELHKHYSKSVVETMAMGVAIIGLFSTYTRTIQLSVEQKSIEQTAKLIIEANENPMITADLKSRYRIPEKPKATSADGIMNYVKMVLAAPGAIRFENKHFKGVPTKSEPAMAYLQDKLGYSFPDLISPLQRGNVVKAVAGILLINLDPAKTKIGLRIKYLVQLVFSKAVNNSVLLAQAYNLMEANGVQLSSNTKGDFGGSEFGRGH